MSQLSDGHFGDQHIRFGQKQRIVYMLSEESKNFLCCTIILVVLHSDTLLPHLNQYYQIAYVKITFHI
jgi:hypothetical protein